MRIHVLNDLHLEFGAFDPPPIDADVVILAGDICTGVRGVEWANQRWPSTPVVYVLGNHEYYGGRVPDTAEALRRAAAPNVHVLQRDSVELGGVVFLGATLWTDMALLRRPRQSVTLLRHGMADYRSIHVSPAADLPGTPDDAEPRLLTPSDTVRYHNQTRRWLSDALEAHAGQPVVVVTHHAPSARSLRVGDHGVVTAAYASNMDDFVTESGALLWVHGHTHRHADYTLGNTRVVCNARGYVDAPASGFEPGFVVEVSFEQRGCEPRR